LATDFSDLDFNAAQSLYSQLLVREAKRKRCALDIVAAVTARRENGSSRSSDLHSPGPSLRDIAVKTGVSPFKIAKSYLSEVGIDFTEFMENPTAVVEEDIRFSLVHLTINFS
jgi:hypothetical protein